MCPRTPRATRTVTLVPSTPLFRSARAEFFRHVARHFLAPVLAADRDRHRPRRQLEGVERHVRGKHVLLEILVAERVAEPIFEPFLARCAEAAAVERPTAPGGAGGGRREDDRGLPQDATPACRPKAQRTSRDQYER